MRNLILIGLLLFSIHAGAQVNSQAGQYDPGMRPEFSEKTTAAERAKELSLQMKKDLKLSPDTTRKIAAINLEYEKKAEEHLQNSPEMTEYDKAVMNKIRKDHMDALRNALTPEQWDLFVMKQKERKLRGSY